MRDAVMKTMQLVTLLAAGAALASGCHTYRPAAPEDVGRAHHVRVYLELPTEFDLGEVTVSNAVQVDGEVVFWNDESLAVSAFAVKAFGGREHPAEWRTLYVPRDRIDRLERRRLDGLRTGIAVGATIAASLLLREVFGGGVSGTTGGTNGPPSR